MATNPIKTQVSGANCSIVDLYDRVAISLGLSTNATYDCTKILVSPKIFEEVEAFHDNSISFGMLWVAYGPKVDEQLKDYEIVLHDGWYIQDEEA